MKKRIIGYRTQIDELIARCPKGTDWNEIIARHLVQIGFFQHERLIHLLVTLCFAILTVGSIIAVVLSGYIPFIILTVLFMTLLIPYVMHYYTLENEVQKMYEQYDRMIEISDDRNR